MELKGNRSIATNKTPVMFDITNMFTSILSEEKEKRKLNLIVQKLLNPAVAVPNKGRPMIFTMPITLFRNI